MNKILIIDDKIDNLVSISALLRSLIKDCVIITAQNGKDGIDAAALKKPDTILLDIQMPGLDGFEVCKILKHNDNTKHIPVIMLTALYTNSKDRVKGLDLGADAFLAKPIDEAELAAQINVMLRIKKAEDKLRDENRNLEQEVSLRTQKLTKEIHERKLIEKELKAAIKQAKESDRLKSAFLANLSHEIRTPMNGIIGFAELLTDSNLQEEQRLDFIKVILDNGDQLLSLINDIIDISKIEAGLIDTKIEIININNELDKMLNLYQLNSDKKSLLLKANKSLPDNECFLSTDKTRFRQILSNLINNALKFTHEGEIEFGYALEADTFQFYVQDTGIGIPPEQHEKIFERFRQVDDSVSKKYGGTGLGLSIIKAYVEKLGGEIGVISEPGDGSTFFFTLPYRKQTNFEIFIAKQKEDKIDQ